MSDRMEVSGTTDRMMRESALIAGIGLLMMAVLAGLANFGAIERLVTDGDATKTAHDILASPGWFRFAIVAMVLVAILDVIVAWALFGFFKPVHEGASRLAAWLRVAYAAVFAVAVSQLVGTLHLLSNTDYLKTFSEAQLRTQALLKIDAFHDIWNISLVFFGLYLVLIGALAFRSGYVPKFVGVLLVIAGIGYLVDSFGTLLVANYSLKVGSLTAFGEVVLMIWLLVRGRSVSASASMVTPERPTPAMSSTSL